MIYIGNFLHVTSQEEILESERRHGDFSLLIEAESHETAILKFRDRILEYRKSSDFFQGDCRIFFIQLLEFESFPRSQALMLNFRSIAGDPFMPFIGCLIPTEESDACRIFDWKNSTPEIDGQDEKLFLEFTGEGGHESL